MTKKTKSIKKTAPKTVSVTKDETPPYIEHGYVVHSLRPQWDILASAARDTDELRGLLTEGWEPFSVVQMQLPDGKVMVYLKRQRSRSRL